MPKQPKKSLSKQEQNIIDATSGGGINSRPVFKGPNSGRDIPLAPSPEPRTMMDLKNIHTGPAKTDPGVVKAQADKAKANSAVKKYAQGVVISKKDEKANPNDFKYLKNK